MNFGSDYRRHPLELRIPPAMITGFLVLLMWGIATYFPVFNVDIPLRLFLTAFLMFMALLLAVTSLTLFVRYHTAIHPHKPDKTTRLVTVGPYRHSRNPMYLSLSLILIGWAIFLTDLIALMLMPAFYAYITRFQIIPEERELNSRFGEEYQQYAEKTPRWL
ncbi:MAG: isoprenylcysteine carboxylmethyltransferase family protein [Balneolales bacterium]